MGRKAKAKYEPKKPEPVREKGTVIPVPVSVPDPISAPISKPEVTVTITAKKKVEETGWVTATAEEVLEAEEAGLLVGYDPVKGLAKFKERT